MTQPLPYEPVAALELHESEWMNDDCFAARIGDAERFFEEMGCLGNEAYRVILANGQRIIVRALSEDRKAARAEARRARLRGVE